MKKVSSSPFFYNVNQIEVNPPRRARISTNQNHRQVLIKVNRRQRAFYEFTVYGFEFGHGELFSNDIAVQGSEFLLIVKFERVQVTSSTKKKGLQKIWNVRCSYERPWYPQMPLSFLRRRCHHTLPHPFAPSCTTHPTLPAPERTSHALRCSR